MPAKSDPYRVDLKRDPEGGFLLVLCGLKTKLWVPDTRGAADVARAELAGRFNVPASQIKIDLRVT